jgi:predicted Zn finger-like uncharacterized protein
MALITRCPVCGTRFKVVPDQLRISDGWVRCGECGEVFDASAELSQGEIPPVGSPAPDGTTTLRSEEGPLPHVPARPSPAAKPEAGSDWFGAHDLDERQPFAWPDQGVASHPDAKFAAFAASPPPSPTPLPAPFRPSLPWHPKDPIDADQPRRQGADVGTGNGPADASAAPANESPHAPYVPYVPYVLRSFDRGEAVAPDGAGAVRGAMARAALEATPPSTDAKPAPGIPARQAVPEVQADDVADEPFDHPRPVDPVELAASDESAGPAQPESLNPTASPTIDEGEARSRASDAPREEPNASVATESDETAESAEPADIADIAEPGHTAHRDNGAGAAGPAGSATDAAEHAPPMPRGPAPATFLPDDDPVPQSLTEFPVDMSTLPEDTVYVAAPPPADIEAALDDRDVSFLKAPVAAKASETLWQRPWMRRGLALLAGLLAVTLALQATVQQRDQIAAWMPATKPALQALCAPLDCTVEPLRQIDAIVIDSSTFTTLRHGVYRLNVVLRNRAAMAIAVPSIELSLTDTQESAVLRRVLQPSDMLAGVPGNIPGHGEWTAAMELTVSDEATIGRIVGYRLLAFYP